MRIPFVLHFEGRVKRLNSVMDQDKLGYSRNPAELYQIDNDGNAYIKPERIV